MKFKTLLFLSPFFFAIALPLFLGCNRVAPLVPPPPAPQVVWANGNVGNWFSSSLAVTTYGGCSVAYAVTAVSDPISGDNSALNLTTASTCGLFFFSATAPVNPSLYYPGHLQFDILLGQPGSNLSTFNIQYNYSIGNYAEYDFPPSLINSLSATSFTHISIPFTSFTIGNGYAQTTVDTPLYVLWTASISGTSITIDNVQWTYN